MQQRARRTKAGNKNPGQSDGSGRINLVASTSIYANSNSINFSDILKAEKESMRRTRYLNNQLGGSPKHTSRFSKRKESGASEICGGAKIVESDEESRALIMSPLVRDGFQEKEM